MGAREAKVRRRRRAIWLLERLTGAVRARESAGGVCEQTEQSSGCG
jgi:hypothetical protein